MTTEIKKELNGAEMKILAEGLGIKIDYAFIGDWKYDKELPAEFERDLLFQEPIHANSEVIQALTQAGFLKDVTRTGFRLTWTVTDEGKAAFREVFSQRAKFVPSTKRDLNYLKHQVENYIFLADEPDCTFDDVLEAYKDKDWNKKEVSGFHAEVIADFSKYFRKYYPNPASKSLGVMKINRNNFFRAGGSKDGEGVKIRIKESQAWILLIKDALYYGYGSLSSPTTKLNNIRNMRELQTFIQVIHPNFKFEIKD